VLIGTHGAGAIFHDIEFLELGNLGDRRRVAVQEGEGWQGVVRIGRRLPVPVLGVFRKELEYPGFSNAPAARASWRARSFLAL